MVNNVIDLRQAIRTRKIGAISEKISDSIPEDVDISIVVESLSTVLSCILDFAAQHSTQEEYDSFIQNVYGLYEITICKDRKN
jgi:hypothetical protein